MADKRDVSEFFERAQDILRIAAAADSGPGETALLLGREGGLRILDSAGWSLSALAMEYGAAAAYRVIRRGSAVRVEGWKGGERCLLEAAGNRWFPVAARTRAV